MTVPSSAEATVGKRFGMQGIRKAFGATVALDGVELSVAAQRPAAASLSSA